MRLRSPLIAPQWEMFKAGAQVLSPELKELALLIAELRFWYK